MVMLEHHHDVGQKPGFSTKPGSFFHWHVILVGRRIPLWGGLIALLVGAIGLLLGVQKMQAQALADKQWNDLYARGVLRIGIDPGWQPFSFYDASGWQGLDADLTREIARRLNLQVQTIPVGYDSMYDALHLWQVDIDVSAVVVDASHGDEYAFSDSYFDAGLFLVSPANSPIRTVDDLANRRVAVALGSDADRSARYWERRLVNLTRVSTADDASAIGMLQTGRADAAIVPGLTAARLTAQGDMWQCSSISAQPYAIALRRDNARLLAALNQTLAQMRADGTLQAIVTRWAGAK
jgi:ABC-type amino acid transport substrate-binding protein